MAVFLFALVAGSLAMYFSNGRSTSPLEDTALYLLFNVSLKYYYRYDSKPSIYGTPRNKCCKLSVTNKTPSEHIREGFLNFWAFIVGYQNRCCCNSAVGYYTAFVVQVELSNFVD